LDTYPLIPFRPCSLERVTVATPAEVPVNDVIEMPSPTFLIKVSNASLVILFFRSLVTTSPRGETFA